MDTMLRHDHPWVHEYFHGLRARRREIELEPRANHFAVGLLIIAAVASAVVFTVWLAKSDIEKQYTLYRINFEGSVTGLSSAGIVRYRGVPVGAVVDIRIDPDNSERIGVTIRVDSETPIKADSAASLELQGITGIRYVQIQGGSHASPRLEAAPGEDVAVIQSTVSTLEALFEDIPTLIVRLAVLVDRASLLLSDKNIAAAEQILQQLESIIGMVAEPRDQVDGIIVDAAKTIKEARKTAETIRGLADELSDEILSLSETARATLDSATGAFAEASTTLRNASGTLESVDESTGALFAEIQETLGDVRKTTVSIGQAADQLNLLIVENRAPLHDFAADGLYEFTRFLVETRALVASLTRIATELESDPARFLFGDAEAGYRPE